MALSDLAIVGFGETKITLRGGVDPYSLAGEVMSSLLATTGFEKHEIDGLIVSRCISAARSSFWAQGLAEFLGLELDFIDSTDAGGCSPVGSVVRAAAAIEAGLCSTVLLLNTDASSSFFPYDNYAYHDQWADPFGLKGPPGAFGLLANRYRHQYGLDFEALGKLAVTQREHALLNENACEKLRVGISIQDYLESRMIADPIRLLDSVMLTDGANGLLVTSRKAAKSRQLDRFVVPVGYGECTNLGGASSQIDITHTGHSVAGAKAFAGAGLKPKDIASFHPYDDFIIAIVLQLEMLGFCEVGHGCDFVREVDFGYEGDLPLNTGGGQISAGQAGLAGGGTNLIEAVRQLFGEAGTRQVANTKNALVTGIGWIPYARNWGSSASLILVPEA